MTSLSEILVISSSSEKERWNPFELISVKITYERKRNVHLKWPCTHRLFWWTRNLSFSKQRWFHVLLQLFIRSWCHITSQQITGFQLNRSAWQTIRLSDRSVSIACFWFRSLTHQQYFTPLFCSAALHCGIQCITQCCCILRMLPKGVYNTVIVILVW